VWGFSKALTSGTLSYQELASSTSKGMNIGFLTHKFDLLGREFLFNPFSDSVENSKVRGEQEVHPVFRLGSGILP
jgi:hypothetical protein